jgi:hypothetical protein
LQATRRTARAALDLPLGDAQLDTQTAENDLLPSVYRTIGSRDQEPPSRDHGFIIRK